MHLSFQAFFQPPLIAMFLYYPKTRQHCIFLAMQGPFQV
jgi:hypothetical protein